MAIQGEYALDPKVFVLPEKHRVICSPPLNTLSESLFFKKNLVEDIIRYASADDTSIPIWTRPIGERGVLTTSH